MHPFIRTYVVGQFSWMRVLRSAAIIYVAVMLYGLFFTHWQIFMPPQPTYADHPGVFALQTADDVSITVTHLANEDADYTILFCHGNAEDLGLLGPFLRSMRDAGFAVLAWDYRGYGTSGGRASVWNTHRDAAAVYAHAVGELQIPPDRLLVHGRSLGGGVACRLAADHDVAGLILESTFTSAFRAGLPVPIVPFDKFNNRRNLRRSQAPVLLIHGMEDPLIPIEHSEQLARIAGERADTWWVEGAGHSDVSWVAGPAYSEALQRFAGRVQTASGGRR